MIKRHRFIAGFALAVVAVVAMGQAAIQTFPPNTVFGRIGVGQYGPGGPIPISQLAAGLGLGTAAHSVPIGKGSTAASFNAATTGTAGQILVDQGSGNDPAFVPMSGSCTLAASGAVSCAGLGGGVNSVSSAYTATSSDCFKTIAAGGNAQYTITLNSAATYGACTLDISNVDTWGSGRGKLLAVTGLVTNPPILYPGMTITLLNVNGTWFQKPGIAVAQAPVGTALYVDGVNGNDANDCLTTAGACLTLQHVFMQVIWQWLEATGGSATGSNAGFDVRLISDPACAPSTGVNCIHGLHYSGIPKQLEGHNSIMIECDSGTATNCTIADNSGNAAIGVFVPINLELRNVTLTGGSAGNNAIAVEKGMVRIQSGVVIGNSGSVAQLQAIDHGSIFVEGTNALTIAGGGGNLALTARGGVIAFDQAAIIFAANAAYSASTLDASTFSAITAVGTSWQLGGFTVTAPNNIACAAGGIVSTSGTISSVPGTNNPIGCTVSGAGQVN